MGFQSTVYIMPAFGTQGDVYNASPMRARSYILNSAQAAYNIIGTTFYTRSADGVAAAGGTTGQFLGLLVASKQYTSFGTTGGGPLAPTMVLPNGVNADLATMGSFVTTLPAIANPGDAVLYDNTTGAIATVAPAGPIPSGFTFAQAFVDYYTVAANGQGVITLTPQYVAPEEALVASAKQSFSIEEARAIFEQIVAEREEKLQKGGSKK